jgi:hypothetical protein
MQTLRQGLIATVIVSASVTTVYAQSPLEREDLSARGFVSIGNGVWQHVTADGAVHREGFGAASLDTVLNSLTQHQHDLNGDRAQSTDGSSSLGLGMLIGSVGQQIAMIEDLKSTAPLNPKASGTFNGCTTGTIGPAATVSSATRTASATIGISGFGPAAPDLLRLGVASARTGLGTPVWDFDATYGTTMAGGFTVTATTATSGTCKLYAYGHNFNVAYSCGRWADAFYNGPC